MRNGLAAAFVGILYLWGASPALGDDSLSTNSAVAHYCGHRNLTVFGTVYSGYQSSPGASTLYSKVGSLDDSSSNFLGSTARIWEMTSSGTVTHRWRNRAHVETPSEVEHPLLPSWAAYLASDVVNVTAPSGTYALQMNYSPSVESPYDEAIDALLGRLFLGWLDTTTDPDDPQWVNAANKQRDGAREGADSKGPFQGSWNEFRTTHTGPLSDYVGYWGVEIDNSDPQYDNSVWAVVDTGGTFGVVPEPGTLVLLCMGVAGPLAWAQVRNRRSCCRRIGGRLRQLLNGQAAGKKKEAAESGA